MANTSQEVLLGYPRGCFWFVTHSLPPPKVTKNVLASTCVLNLAIPVESRVWLYICVSSSYQALRTKLPTSTVPLWSFQPSTRGLRSPPPQTFCSHREGVTRSKTFSTRFRSLWSTQKVHKIFSWRTKKGLKGEFPNKHETSTIKKIEPVNISLIF